MTETKVVAEIVNLRQARKRRARQEKAAKAAENRRAFGRSKAERTSDEAEREKLQSTLDGQKLEGDEE